MAEKKQKTSIDMKKSNSLHNVGNRSLSKYSTGGNKNL